MDDATAQKEIARLTVVRLLQKTKKDLENLRFQFHHNEKNLLALIAQYEKELQGR